jgi:hypothetical protein
MIDDFHSEDRKIREKVDFPGIPMRLLIVLAIKEAQHDAKNPDSPESRRLLCFLPAG